MSSILEYTSASGPRVRHTTIRLPVSPPNRMPMAIASEPCTAEPVSELVDWIS